MDANDSARASSGFGAGRLFLADTRIALIWLNWMRHWALQRVFGLSRAHSNALTVVVVLTAADAGVTLAGRAIRAPLRISRTDAATGGILVREAARGIAGPRSRDVPLFGTLVIVAGLGAVALPGIRQAVRTLRINEQRLRKQRIGRYVAPAARRG